MCCRKSWRRFDEPFADSSAIPTFLVSREIRKHVTVALSGDGGDELFAGYRSYLGEYWREKYLMIPALLRKSILEPLVESTTDSRETRFGELSRRAKKFICGSRGPFEERMLALKQVIPAPVRQRLLSCAADDPALIWVRELISRSSGDTISRMLYTDLVDSLPGDMLAKVDLMSMRNSLEVRVPMLDHQVVETRLPDSRPAQATAWHHQVYPEGNIQGPAAAGAYPPAEIRIRDPHQSLAKDGFEVSGRSVSVRGADPRPGHF